MCKKVLSVKEYCNLPVFYLLFFCITICVNCSRVGESLASWGNLGENSANPTFYNQSLPNMSDDKILRYKGINIHYDSSLADLVLAEEIRAYKPKDPEFLPNTFEPKHIVFRFQGAYSRKYDQPEIKIYSVKDYKALAATTGNYAKEFCEKFEFLKTVLLTKPSEINGEYPFIPWLNAAQVIHCHKTYISFKNGNGIAYVTQFNHSDPYLINNEQLLYVFQGLTSDNRYFISATFPIRVSFLPDDRTATNYKEYTQPDDFYNRASLSQHQDEYHRYLLQVERELEETPSQDFQPSLVILNEMFSSLEIPSDLFSK